MGDLGYDYTGRHVLVTGGSRGTGLAVAFAFAEVGASVTVTGRQPHVSAYSADLMGFAYRPLDLTDPEQIHAFAEDTRRVDVLVSAAGCELPESAVGAERDFILQAVRLGLAGPVQLATKLRAKLAASSGPGGGSVIALPAVKRWQNLYEVPSPQQYAVEVQRTGALFARHGVRYNAISACPPRPTAPAAAPALALVGGTTTSRWQTTLTRPAVSGLDRQIAAVSVFLGSAGATGLTGQTLTVDDLAGD